jgi:hypothetical protein
VNSAGFRDELIKYLAVAKHCDYAQLSQCFHTTIKDIKGNSVNVPNRGADLGLTFGVNSPGQSWYAVPAPGNASGLILNNGTLMHVLYNPACTENISVYASADTYGQNHVCANIVFDTNGWKSPNQVGKDIGFASVISPINTVVIGVAPDTDHLDHADWATAQSECMKKGDVWHLPTKDELNNIVYNRTIIGNFATDNYWSATEYVPNPTYAWGQYTGAGAGNGIQHYADFNKTTVFTGVRCVRR